MVLKYFWPKEGLKNAEKQNWPGFYQTGGRKGMSAIETVTINELIVKYHRITRQPIFIHQDDAATCFDRIIMNNAILSS